MQNTERQHTARGDAVTPPRPSRTDPELPPYREHAAPGSAATPPTPPRFPQPRPIPGSRERVAQALRVLLASALIGVSGIPAVDAQDLTSSPAVPSVGPTPSDSGHATTASPWPTPLRLARSDAAPGASPSGQLPPLPDVTVTAPRPPTSQELAGEAVSDFVTSHSTPSLVIHQLARWRERICPLTLGLSPVFNAFVSARIIAVATAVGAPYDAAPQCRPHNVQIFFATEPQKQLNEVVRLDARLLGFHYPHQTEKLATFTRTAQGWYVTATRNDVGVEAVDDPMPLPVGRPWSFSSVVPAGRPGSRLYNGRRSLIVNALIVVDTKKVQNMSIESVSDYLAMLVLSEAQSPDTCSQLPSIIDLMAPNCGDKDKPTQMTAGDLAFLKALYSTDLEQPLVLERSSIQDKMLHEFASH